MRESKASKEVVERRRQLMDEHRKWEEDNNVVWESERELRIELRGFDTDAVEEEYNEETIEFLLKVKEEEVE